MTDPLRFEVPGTPPSVNHMYAPRERMGAWYKTSDTSSYQSIAGLCVRLAMKKPWKEWLKTYTGQLICNYWFHLDVDMDCSNAFKAIEDAIAHELRVNDSRFLPRAMGKTTGNKKPYILVEISPLEAI